VALCRRKSQRHRRRMAWQRMGLRCSSPPTDAWGSLVGAQPTLAGPAGNGAIDPKGDVPHRSTSVSVRVVFPTLAGGPLRYTFVYRERPKAEW
jgi:hypothetical protein